jgi:hypothetical protein
MVPPFTGASVQQRLLRAVCITGMEVRVPRKGVLCTGISYMIPRLHVRNRKSCHGPASTN